MLDKASETKLSKVHPRLAEKVRELVVLMADDVRVVSGLRTYAEQDALFAQGRTKPGIIVTNARAGQSNHNFGLAVDLCPFADGQPDWDNRAKFKSIGIFARTVGLEWGGDWRHILDQPHVQLKGLSVRECRDIYSQGGLPAVWEAADRLAPVPAGGNVGSLTEIVGSSNPITGATDSAAREPTSHTVVSGDTLSGLSSKFQISVSAIKHLNGLTSDLIKVGQILKMS